MKNNITVYSTLLFLSLFILVTGSVAADEKSCADKLSLEAFRAHAFTHSPLVAEIDSEYAHNLADAFETRVLANPQLDASQTFTRNRHEDSNDAQVEVSISQPLRISDFGTRDTVAALLKKAGDTEKRAKLLELSQRVVLHYQTLSALQQTEAIITSAEQRATKKASLIREGVKKGLLSEGDAQLFDGEKFRLQAERKGITASRALLQNELSKSIGVSCAVATTEREMLGEIPSEEILLEKARGSELSEVARLHLLSDLTSEQVRLAEMDAYPQLTPRIIYEHTNDGSDFVGAGVSIPLSFWNRNQAEQLRAKAAFRLAESKKNTLENGGLASQIKNLRRSAVNSQEQAELFFQKVIPSFEGALKSQEKLYAEGKGNVLEVWQTLRTVNEVQTKGLSLWIEAITARVQLSLLIGEEI